MQKLALLVITLPLMASESENPLINRTLSIKNFMIEHQPTPERDNFLPTSHRCCADRLCSCATKCCVVTMTPVAQVLVSLLVCCGCMTGEKK